MLENLRLISFLPFLVLMLACQNHTKSNYQMLEQGYEIFGKNNPKLFGTDGVYDPVTSILIDRFGSTATYKGFFTISSFLIEDPALILNYPQPFSYLDWSKVYNIDRLKTTTIKNHSKIFLTAYLINPPINPTTEKPFVTGSFVLTDPNGDVYKQARFNVLTPKDDFKLANFNWMKEPIAIEIHADGLIGDWNIEIEFKDQIKGVVFRLSQRLKVEEASSVPKLPKVEFFKDTK